MTPDTPDIPVSTRTAPGDIIDQLEDAIRRVSNGYYRLVLLAGPAGSGKTSLFQTLGQKQDCRLVNVNLELSKRLLELTRSQRSRQVERLTKDLMDSAPGDVVLLDNIEILFDTDLEVEPLRLLQGLSRNRTVVVSWCGSYTDGTLTYAKPGHPEFVQFKEVDAVVVPIGGATDTLGNQ